MSFSVTSVQREQGAWLISPAGRLDGTTAPDLERELAPLLGESPRSLVFDLRDLEYISSAGLRVFFKAMKAMKESGGTCLLTHLQPPIKKVFDIVNALPDMQIFRSIEEADAYLDLMQQKEKEKQRENLD
jgi:anti-anti-sigma factor